MHYAQYYELQPQLPRIRLERDVPWTWKLLATASSGLLLIGLLLFPLAVDGGASQHTNQTTVTIIASALAGTAYASSVAILFFQSQSPKYLLHSVFIPFLLSNLIGLFNLVVTLACRNLFPLTRLGVLVIALCGTFALFYASAAALVSVNSGFCFGPRIGQAGEDRTYLLSDEEMQRRQLLKLLQERGGVDVAPSPEVVHDTFHIEIPRGSASY
ncbi:hypothetical protein ASPZODRAFT_139402 [Penicilliopsis zonata CBS 506.65]|uniref:Uncharacterized protein n=1 Tax=Penicilliopsis zonata CBS 506.65 TaxID=1073090 RepID=A0A1L9SSI4_9EURO|nr:hypothetical protein ASPZODRAFT_139402 [Penicilliopsis zonata CBS 506.65]OJJ50071.1 hypothetical protein ASPZODRAFT_139402 [Penicilliopsis zonata CBS 506.65]